MPTFHQQVRRIRFLLRGSRLLGLALLLAALGTTLWLLLGIADFFGSFESTARVAVTAGLAALCAACLLAGLLRALKVPASRAARHADALLTGSRTPAAAALSLDPASTPLAAFLATRTLESAAAALAALPLKHLIPWRPLGLAALVLTIPLAATGILRLSAPGPFATIAARLLHPRTDLPPHSPFRFTLDPDRPATVYGGEILVIATLGGPPPQQPVECLIRQARTGEIVRLPAFRESPTRFSRKLDGLTEPISIAFAIGRARSAWHPVEILLQPNILSGLVRLSPPAYTGLPDAQVPLDTNEIAVVEGATVTLELSSNRPLGSATLTFTPNSSPGSTPATETLEATLPVPKTAAFTWTATRSGRLSATLRDVRGTPSRQPLDLAFRALPDLPPNVELDSPPRQLLATPHAKIPVSGRAEDDHALAKIQFIRTLAGFRDRTHVVAPALRDKSFDFSDTLDLEDLGLEPGQIIELMLDASDHNPSLLGQGSSEISQIKIISEDDYARFIRAKTTLAQFSARFQAARDAIDNARKALEDLDQKALQQNEKSEPETLAEAAKKTAEVQQKAADLLEKIAGDFPAFDLEKRLRDLAGEQAENLRENARALQDIDPEIHPEQLRKDIDEMLERLGHQKPQFKQLDADVEQVNQAAALMEMAARFRAIYESQKSLAKRFAIIVEELRQGEDRNRRLLPSLADTQEKNRTALDEFKTELRRRAEALPNDNPNLAPLIESALKFLNELDLAAPESLMDAAAAHGKAGQANDAYTNAELARALLERLMSEPEPFPQACKGQSPKFDVPQPDLNATLQQLLEALLNQNPGSNENPGPPGQGTGGFSPSGNPASGFPMDLPVVGPDRLQFDPLNSASGKTGGNQGKTGPVPPLPNTAESGTLKPNSKTGGDPSTPHPETNPEL
jgi:hypothetical protein